MQLTKWEKETIINFNEEDDFATVYTRSKGTMTYMKNKGYAPFKTDTDEGGHIYGMTWKIPRTKVRLPSALIKVPRKRRKRVIGKNAPVKPNSNT